MHLAIILDPVHLIIKSARDQSQREEERPPDQQFN
jgi:hypothetical protein